MTKRTLSTITMTITVILMTALAALPTSAQPDPTASIQVADQLSTDGTILVAKVVTNTPAFVVIYADSGDDEPGVVLGYTAVSAGEHDNVSVVIDPATLAPALRAAVHVDDNEAGVFEFGAVEGADAPITVNDKPVAQSFTARALLARDQIVEDQVTIAAVTVAEPAWVVIHAGDAQQIGDVIGQVPVPAGTTAGLTVAIEPGASTNILWPMLHADTGTQNEFEFGAVEGADQPLVVGDDAATLPISTVPIVRVAADQLILDGNGIIADSTASVEIGSVLSDGPGFLAVHRDEAGNPGTIIGFTPVVDGLSKNITVEIDPALVTPNLWAMLHRDDHEIGAFEFETVEEADMPEMVDDAPVSAMVQVAPFMSFPARTEDTNELVFERVMIDQPGFVVIHADDPTGPVLAEKPLEAGLNENVAVALDLDSLTEPVFPVLHTDTNVIGTLEFGSVAGADTPLLLNGRFISTTVNLSDLLSVLSPVCTVLASGDVNLYGEPNAGAPVSGSLTQGSTLDVVGQIQAADGVVWWQTSDGNWVSSQVVSEQARCENLPVVSN